MFKLLLVLRPRHRRISIDNANAYYELGIRHALEEKRTYLLRAKAMTHDVPFDLKTDRYLPTMPLRRQRPWTSSSTD